MKTFFIASSRKFYNEAKKLNRIEAQITKNSNEAELVRILEIAKKQLEAIKSVSK